MCDVVVDSHCHTFNLRDIPAARFLELTHQIPRNSVVDALVAMTPEFKAEIEYLDCLERGEQGPLMPAGRWQPSHSDVIRIREGRASLALLAELTDGVDEVGTRLVAEIIGTIEFVFMMTCPSFSTCIS